MQVFGVRVPRLGMGTQHGFSVALKAFSQWRWPQAPTWPEL